MSFAKMTNLDENLAPSNLGHLDMAICRLKLIPSRVAFKLGKSADESAPCRRFEEVAWDAEFSSGLLTYRINGVDASFKIDAYAVYEFKSL